MNSPIVTPDLVARIIKSENDASLSRLKGVQRMEGNPLGVAVREFNHVVATMMCAHPEAWWNRIAGLASGDENLIDEILAWYHKANVQGYFEIVPYQSSESLLRALAARGFYQSSFRSVLCSVPEPGQPPPAVGIVVREQEDLTLFSELARETGFAPEGDAGFWKQVTRAEFAEWRCYVAFVNGEAAAHGALYVRERVGACAFGATKEQFRGRGCQPALLRQRITDAAASRCDLIISTANPGSISQRNMERVGFRLAYTKAIWTAR